MKKIAILLCIATGLISCGNKKDEINLPITRTYDCDVLVIGGGPAGLSAAICSARKGVKTILAERNGCLGGMATSGMVAPLMSSTTPDGKTMIIRGFFEEFVDSMIAANGAIHPLKSEIGSNVLRKQPKTFASRLVWNCFTISSLSKLILRTTKSPQHILRQKLASGKSLQKHI